MNRWLLGYLQDFRQLRHYIITAAVLFFAGIWVGADSELFQHFLNEQIRSLGEIASELSERDHANALFFIFIFLNNTIKSILVMYLGGLFILIPVVFLVMNGMILGYLFAIAAAANMDVWGMFIKGILPHGIIELPVIIIACAFGLRFGVLVLKMLTGLFRTDETRSHNNAETQYFLKRSLHMVLFLVITLFGAAIIESTFTFWLMNQ